MNEIGNESPVQELREEEIVEPKNARRLLAFVRGETLSRSIDVEVSEDEVFVWPHLIYKELLAAMLAVIIFWILALLVDAPLEGIANPTHSPNPAKAPWYFVGLQELLVYFDPWIAGVMIPGLIVAGLTAIPYLDRNRQATGEYNFSQRRFAIGFFAFGLAMWMLLTIVGSILRGPNWAWYWFWEDWAGSKATVPTRNLPNVLGLLLLMTYSCIGFFIPRRISPSFHKRLGRARYVITMAFVMLMVGVATKIVLRLAFNVKYILTTSWFNI